MTEPVNYDKPVPRVPKTAERVEEVRVRNRRREYLQQHPDYFDSLDHELADAVLYERLIKRFQSASERTAEGKAKGYGRTLEASLMRGETKMAKLAAAASPVPLELAGVAEREAEPDGDKTWHVTPPTDKEHGRQLWKEFLEDRFIKGGDEDFDYASVDSDQGLDALERQDKQDSWFDDQEPGWASGGDGDIRGETGVQDF